MKIGILGSRGIPNNYGGFEQFAQYLAKGLLELGCKVYVYNSHNHPYKKPSWEGVNIIHKYDPEYLIGLSGQFIYDFNCIMDSRRRKFDILLQLGYTTNAVWSFLLPQKPDKICNPDGMEWQRSKYPGLIKRFLKFSEKKAALTNDLLIADSKVIKDYYIKKYGVPTRFVAYPAEVFKTPDCSVLKKYNLQKYSYSMLIARMQPDNNIDRILKGYTNSNSEKPLLVIGNYNNKYGKCLQNTYTDSRIKFLGGIYLQNDLNNLRHFSHLYFHGHSAGGTNPSLLEAMGSSALICAHNNPFNKSVLGSEAFYFESSTEITDIVESIKHKSRYELFININKEKIAAHYSPSQIVNSYFQAFTDLKNKYKAH